jgi:dihydrodipicolinate synthase/N-acetylneuraminate lyase
VSVASNLIPEVMVAFVNACLAGNFSPKHCFKAILPAHARPDDASDELVPVKHTAL